MKYLVTVVQGITVTADSPKEAEAQGLAMCDGGFAETIAGRGRTTRREETGAMNLYDEDALVEAIDQEASPGRSGKLLVRFDPNAALRTVYPGVVGLYFADEPRAS